jgi:hypothetical protein
VFTTELDFVPIALMSAACSEHVAAADVPARRDDPTYHLRRTRRDSNGRTL